VLKFFDFQRQHQFDDLQARFALLLRDRASVNVNPIAMLKTRSSLMLMD